jgi:hypothetical protein
VTRTTRTERRCERDGRRAMSGRRVAALVGLVGVGVLAAGCGGNSASVASVASRTTSSATTTNRHPSSGRLADGRETGSRRPAAHTFIDAGDTAHGTRFAACMRQHHVPSFPHPNPQGIIALGPTVDERSPTFDAAPRPPAPPSRRLRPTTLQHRTGASAARAAHHLQVHALARDQGLPRPRGRRAPPPPADRRPRPERPAIPNRIQRLPIAPTWRHPLEGPGWHQLRRLSRCFLGAAKLRCASMRTGPPASTSSGANSAHAREALARERTVVAWRRRVRPAVTGLLSGLIRVRA